MSIIEIVVVVSIAIIGVMSILQLFNVEIRAERLRREELSVYALLAESLEAVRSVRDADWANISSLSTGTNYYPEISGSSWILSNLDPGPIDGFTRWIVVDEVRRDANFDITDSGGVIDADTLKIIAYAEWESYGITKTKSITMYLTNWQ